MRRKQATKSNQRPLSTAPETAAVSGRELGFAIERAAQYLSETSGRALAGLEGDAIRERAASIVTECISAALQQDTQTTGVACDGDVIAVAEIMPAILGRAAGLRLRLARSLTIATLSLPTRMPDGWLEALVRGPRKVHRFQWSSEYGPLMALDCAQSDGMGRAAITALDPNEDYAVLRGQRGAIFLFPLRGAMDELDTLFPYTDEEQKVVRGDEGNQGD